MARYTESKCRLCRREQTKLFLKGAKCYTEKCPFTKRQTVPGAHSSSRSRKTAYGLQFSEKQKVKKTYGMLEGQFRKTFELASKETGNTGVRLLQLLELRLDNVIYRLGFGESRGHAKQLVNHGLILVNDKKISIPSYTLKVGDIVKVKPSKAEKGILPANEEIAKRMKTPEWLEKGKGYEGRVSQVPSRSMIDEGIKEQLIVEFYSR